MACNSRIETEGTTMTHSPILSIRAVAAVVLLTLAGCKKESTVPSGSRFTSLLFDASSPAAREALATPVSYQLTEENYAQWEQAQRFLDAVPRSEFASASGAQGTAIDRAVQTLEASPRARTAIERTGLTVRDFVLETIALAQAAEAQAGRTPNGVTVPAENVQFVQRYESRIMQPRNQAQATPTRTDTYDRADTAAVGVQSPTDAGAEVNVGADVRNADSASVGAGGRGSDSIGLKVRQPQQPKPPVDTARDTIPR